MGFRQCCYLLSTGIETHPESRQPAGDTFDFIGCRPHESTLRSEALHYFAWCMCLHSSHFRYSLRMHAIAISQTSQQHNKMVIHIIFDCYLPEEYLRPICERLLAFQGKAHSSTVSGRDALAQRLR